MKSITRFLLLALCLAHGAAGADPVTTPVGSNLTQYNSGMGAINNNNWNNLMNNRSGGTTAATADFGNCNAVILRCAQPKCASGGCAGMDVARPIVAGCVQSNANCKQYGNDLIEYITAQLVANSTARANEQALAAQAAASQAAAAQSAQQIQAMQAQMQQMQSEMAAQNAETVAQLQSALAEQKQLTAQAIADASAANAVTTTGAVPAGNNASANNMVSSPSGENQITAAQMAAAQAGVSADILMREQISGQILSKIENAEVAMKSLKASMENTFTYAGCDRTGSNCVGPKRVKAFKNRALEFFDPYNDVLDELFEALLTAQAVGVDITDIYMLLNGSCNVWGQYLCTGSTNLGTYNTESCQGGKSVLFSGTKNANGEYTGSTRGGHECVYGQAVPPEDSPACTLNKTLSDNEMDVVRREWLDPSKGDDSMLRIGCASSALETSAFFRSRKKKASIDIETLERIIAQDAPETFGTRYGIKTTAETDGVKYCKVGPTTYQDLQRIASLKQLPNTICVPDNRLLQYSQNEGFLTSGDGVGANIDAIAHKCNNFSSVDQKYHSDKKYDSYNACVCEAGTSGGIWENDECKCGDNKTWNQQNFACEGGGENKTLPIRQLSFQDCNSTGGDVDITNPSYCKCKSIQYNPFVHVCENGMLLPKSKTMGGLKTGNNNSINNWLKK